MHLCDQCEFILDIHFEQHIVHLWTKNTKSQLKHHKIAFHPSFYIAADEDRLSHSIDTRLHNRSLLEIAKIVATHPNVIAVDVVQRYLDSSQASPKQVLKVKLYSYRVFEKTIQAFKDRAFNLFNIDINRRQHFFLDINGYPMGACHIKLKPHFPYQYQESSIDHYRDYYEIPDDCLEIDEVIMMDDYQYIDYFIPDLKIITIEIKYSIQNVFPEYTDPVDAITIKEQDYHDARIIDVQQYILKKSIDRINNEQQLLLEFIQKVKEIDPDFILIDRGDAFNLDYLAYRCMKNGIAHQFNLSRINKPHYYRKNKQGQSYMTYGMMIHREPVIYLAGRIHLDATNSFMLRESGIAGLIDLARLSGTPPDRTSRASIGTILTAAEFLVNQSTTPPTLIPPNKPNGEYFKPAELLMIADNGGLIFPATPGVYDNIWAIDFTSLYPFIMKNHNIGSETVLCQHEDCKTNPQIVVPEIGYHICAKKEAVVARTMETILKKRIKLKKMKKTAADPDTRARYKGMDEGLKWILVCCFGYLGFKNSRWGSIEGHQSVCAYGRRYLLEARLIAEEMGYEIIGGITDSLFIRPLREELDDPHKIQELAMRITTKTNIPMDVEGRFNWIVFCNVKNYGEVAALNRYFGYFGNDEFKLRGIRMRQRRLTNLEKQFQKELLEYFKTSSNIKDFMSRMESAQQLLFKWKRKLRRREVDTRDLIIKLTSGKGVGNYKSKTHQALVTQAYSDHGRIVVAGQSFKYIVRDDRLRTTNRIIIEPLVCDDSPYDVDWYCTMLDRAFLEIVEAPQMQHFGRIVYGGQPREFSIDDFDFDNTNNTNMFESNDVSQSVEVNYQRRKGLEVFFE